MNFVLSAILILLNPDILKSVIAVNGMYLTKKCDCKRATKKCDDGHFMRSKSEMLIDNWLYNKGIPHAYEVSVYLPQNPDKPLLCDFYLPQGNVYIEHWGLEDNEQYEKRKAEKIALYDKNKLNRIDLNENSIERLNDILPRELGKYIKSN